MTDQPPEPLAPSAGPRPRVGERPGAEVHQPAVQVARDVTAGRDAYVGETINQHNYVQVTTPPAFSLSVLPPPSLPDEDAGPSQWLVARHEVVPFQGAAAVAQLKGLQEWLTGPTRRAARLITGAGGAGKTRLALALARHAQAEGWHVLIARPATDGLPFTDAGLLLVPRRPETAVGVLVVVDYADRWSDQPLEDLFAHPDLNPTPAAIPAPGGPTSGTDDAQAASEQQDGLPAWLLRVRVVLLARTADFWPILRDSLRARGYNVSEERAPVLAAASALAADERAAMFVAAATAFAEGPFSRIQSTADHRCGTTDSRGLEGLPVPDLSDPVYGLVLSVQTAALAAIFASREGDAIPSEPDEVSQALLDRERKHWRRMAARQGRPDLAGHPMARTVLLACLCPRSGHAAALELLGQPEIGTTTPQALLDLHGLCYPPALAGALLEPLLPDRLAEDFVAFTLRDDPAAVTITRRLLTTDSSTRQLPGIGTSLTVLVEAAHRHPNVGVEILTPVLWQSPDIAATLTGAGIARLASLKSIPLEVIHEVSASIRRRTAPSGTHYLLATGIAALAQRLYLEGKDQDATPATRVEQLTDLSHWLAQSGQHQEALLRQEEAIDLLQNDPPESASATASAHAFQTLAIRLAQVGSYAAAITPAETAVGIYRELRDQDDPSTMSSLASALTTLATRYGQVGRREDGLECAKESVEIRSLLATKDPERHLPDLALALNALGTRYSALGYWREALDVTERAAASRRELAQRDPAAHLPGLALTLNNLGVRYSRAGRAEDGLRVTLEAISIYYDLMLQNPDAYRGNLAMALNNLGSRYSDIGRPQEAVEFAEQAVELRRQMALDAPAANLPGLAAALNNFSARLRRVGRYSESLRAAEESVAIRRSLSLETKDAYSADLASALRSHSLALADAGDRPRALAAAQESVEIYRPLHKRFGEATAPALARSLAAVARACIGDAGLAKAGLDAALEAERLFSSVEEERSSTIDRALEELELTVEALRKMCHSRDGVDHST